MRKNSYVTARVEKTLKARADKVLRRVGVTRTELITMLLHQVVLRNGIPFDVRIPNKTTLEAFAESDAGKGEAHAGSTAEIFDRVVKANA